MKSKLIVLLFVLFVLINFQNCKKSEVFDSKFPTRFSYLDQNIMTSAKDQRNLGSCGVFAAMGVFEALIKQKTGIDTDLSEQHYINGSGTWVSTGVNPGMVYQFIQENGIVLESRLPYTANQNEDLPEGNMDYYLNSHAQVSLENLSTREARDKIKELLMQHGPVATAMDGMSDLHNYSGGVYQTSPYATARFGHWVVIVGWQDDSSISTGGYWIIKNSWGESWGNSGFGNIAYESANIDKYVIMYAVYNP